MIVRFAKRCILIFILAGYGLQAQDTDAPETLPPVTEPVVADPPLVDSPGADTVPADPAVFEDVPRKKADVSEQKDFDWQRHRWEGRHRNRDKDILRILGNVTVKEGQTVGDVVVIAGKLTVDGAVDGSIVSVGSETFINGPVRDGVVVVGGMKAKFGPKAELNRDVVVVGEGEADPSAYFARGFHPVEVPDLPDIVPFVAGAKDFLFQGVMMARPLPPSVKWVWWVHAAIFLGLLALTLIFPRPVRAGSEAIMDRPIMSMFSGFLTVILFVPVLALISLTVVGLPVGIVGIIMAALFGKAALLTFLGQQIGRSLNVSLLQTPLVAMVVGALLLAALYMVPVVGLLVWIIATLLGIGSIMVATASALNNRPTVPTPTSYIAPPGSVPPVDPTSTTMSIAVTTAPMVFNRVGFWKRTFAALLDLILLSIPMGLAHGFAPLLLICYFVAMWSWRGTTIGMICLGLKIVRTDGTEIDFAVALVRSLAACFSFIVFLLGFFWAGWDKEKQSWHDKIAGTIVVQVPKGVSLL